MRTVSVIANQNLADIAVQEFGSIDAVFDIALANDISITSSLSPGTTLLIPEVSYEVEIAQYFKGINKKISTNTNDNINLNYDFPVGEFPISL